MAEPRLAELVAALSLGIDLGFGVVAVLDAVVAGAGTALALGVGDATFVLCLAGFALFARHAIASAQQTFVVRFPS